MTANAPSSFAHCVKVTRSAAGGATVTHAWKQPGDARHAWRRSQRRFRGYEQAERHARRLEADLRKAGLMLEKKDRENAS